ncbi:MAG TPA: hypothetical protein VK668_09100 [Mucilaginibacter sp.]|nr:hypothetical protein [Mucilaginibacter sp.]
MNSQTLLQVLLVLHITGFTIMAGTVVADTSIYIRLKKYFIADKGKALTMLESVAAFPALIGAGALLLILTGIGMVSILPVFAGMIWFRIKMILVVAIIINGAVIGRRIVLRLKKLLVENAHSGDEAIEVIKGKLNMIYVSQLLLFLVIFILSVFKF